MGYTMSCSYACMANIQINIKVIEVSTYEGISEWHETSRQAIVRPLKALMSSR